MTELELLKLRLNEIESRLLASNVEERLQRLERFMRGVRDGAEGLYPKRKYDRELQAIRKEIKKTCTPKARRATRAG